MTESTKNRIAIIAVSVAALSLCTVLIIQWFPRKSTITINTVPMPTSTASPEVTTTTREMRIAINTATLEELLTLPMMTQEAAVAIKSYLYDHAAITQWETLLTLENITPQMVEKWKSVADLF